MTMAENNIVDFIQKTLDKNKGFMKVLSLKKLLSAETKRELGIKGNDFGKIVAKKLEQVTENRFIFTRKGNVTFISVPIEPSDIVMSLLSEDKAFDTRVASRLPITKPQFSAIINELVEKGLVTLRLDDKMRARIFKAPAKKKPAAPVKPTASGEYTPEKFREAFDDLNKERIFVSIPELRRKLDWPREVFDNMLRDLRSKRVIQLHESNVNPDDVKDCFFDENKVRMGLVTWNGR